MSTSSAAQNTSITSPAAPKMISRAVRASSLHAARERSLEEVEVVNDRVEVSGFLVYLPIGAQSRQGRRSAMVPGPRFSNGVSGLLIPGGGAAIST